MIEGNRLQIKKIAARFLGVLILMLILVFVWRYVHTGKIVVTTNDKTNVITLTAVKDEDEQSSEGDTAVIKKSQGNLNISVPSGKYVISVSGKLLSVRKNVSLGARQTLTYKLNTPNAVNAEPVTGMAAGSLAANDSQLLFIDSKVNYLSKIDNQNNLSHLGNQSLRNVKWADMTYGVGQDSNERLYVVNNGNIVPLRVPESYDSKVNFAVSKNRDIYLSFNKNVYVGSGNGFKKIYTAESVPSSLIAANGKVAVVFTPPDGSGEEPKVIVLDKSGHVIKKAEIDGGVGSWSPDGEKLALIDYEESSVIVNEDLKELAVLPNETISHPAWLDSNTLIYNVNNEVWSYNLKEQLASVVSVLTPGSTINEIAVSEDAKYIYAALTNDNGGEIERIGLKGQKAPPIVYQLDAFLPVDLQDSSINYVNFYGSPIILVQPFGDTALSPQANLQAAQNELHQDGLDLSQLQLRLGSAIGT